VILVPAPHGFSNVSQLDLVGISSDSTAIDTPDGRNIVLKDPDGPHRLWLRGQDHGAGMAALVPLDDDVPSRLSGLLRFRRRLAGRRAGSLPRAWTITRRLRERLLPMTRALDGHLAGASYREIAQAVHGSGPVAGSGWRTSPLRGQTIRLIRDGVLMMQGDYRKLLRGSR
jgi:hypothetical protein